MKKAVQLFLLLFYTFGTFCLQLGDFSQLTDLPEMYRHCKATEDKDMNPFDFISDHLVNIDGLFDKHGNGDEQMPHQPIQNHHHAKVNISIVTILNCGLQPIYFGQIERPIPSDKQLPSPYISEIFRPPIV